MKKLLLVVFVAIIAGVGVYDYAIVFRPCEKPIRYAIGNFDERFGISREELKTMILQAEEAWEKPIGKELFQYDPNANLKINLIYDERQKRTIEERDLRSKIDATGQSYDGMVGEYDRLHEELQKRQAAYETAKAGYAAELSEYNREVDYWNKRKDIPQADYDRISGIKNRLQVTQKNLEREMQSINAQAEAVNSLADKINSLARNLNLDVEFYNGKFGKAKEFDQGIYTGNAINVYQFSETEDLQLVLAHELGHALDIDHVDSPEAIMHYLMQKQDLENIHATGSDVEELMKVCRIE